VTHLVSAPLRRVRLTFSVCSVGGYYEPEKRLTGAFSDSNSVGAPCRSITEGARRHPSYGPHFGGGPATKLDVYVQCGTGARCSRAQNRW